MKTTSTHLYKDYLSECRDIALKLSSKKFPLDKIGALIGKENAEKFKYASGYVNLDLLYMVLNSNSEPRAEMRYKYKNKEGVVKQRVSAQIYGQIVALNYEIAMTGLKIKKKDMWELPEVILAMPDIKERKKHVGRFINHKCEGVINYEFYLLLKSCAIKYFMVEWPFSE
jgi:hypothetical protein